MLTPQTKNVWSLIDRFLSRVDRSGACWLWTGRVDKNGYGVIDCGGDLKAHRIAYELAFDVSPGELCVCHRCDNPRCVRSDHLFLGTSRENSADRDAKGRQARGERQPLSKLTADDVQAIRAAWGQGETQNSLARRFGVTTTTISAITNRVTWRHVA